MLSRISDRFPKGQISEKEHTEHSSGHHLLLSLPLGLPVCQSAVVIVVTETVAAGSAESVAEFVASVGTVAVVDKIVAAGMDSANMDFRT